MWSLSCIYAWNNDLCPADGGESDSTCLSPSYHNILICLLKQYVYLFPDAGVSSWRRRWGSSSRSISTWLGGRNWYMWNWWNGYKHKCKIGLLHLDNLFTFKVFPRGVMLVPLNHFPIWTLHWLLFISVFWWHRYFNHAGIQTIFPRTYCRLSRSMCKASYGWWYVIPYFIFEFSWNHILILSICDIIQVA